MADDDTTLDPGALEQELVRLGEEQARLEADLREADRLLGIERATTHPHRSSLGPFEWSVLAFVVSAAGSTIARIGFLVGLFG